MLNQQMSNNAMTAANINALIQQQQQQQQQQQSQIQQSHIQQSQQQQSVNYAQVR
jgi:hypothetical protein